uniref:Uncharacterized protein n=1 Tax=Anguilla anguilla TaxID=7936 RepID=A0A0E9S147_ANGAN
MIKRLYVNMQSKCQSLPFYIVIISMLQYSIYSHYSSCNIQYSQCTGK